MFRNSWRRWLDRRSQLRVRDHDVRLGSRSFLPRVEPLEGRTLLTAGALDPTFGTGGKVLTDFGGADDEARAVVIQPDHKIVVAGLARIGGNPKFALVRYNPDGSFDTSFGTEGKVITEFAGGSSGASAVVLQPDRKIVAAGWAAGLFALARYNPDGSLDPSFGTGGKVTTDGPRPGTNERAEAVVLQPDSKIVAAGSSDAGSEAGGFALARYNADGSLDTGFGTGGLVMPTSSGLFSSINGIAAQADGKIVATGHTLFHFRLARYQPNGSREFLIQVAPSVGSGNDVVLQRDGKIVVVGSANSQLTLARHNLDGNPDPTFGTGGLFQGGITGLSNERANGAVLQPDGKILVAGSVSTISFVTFDFLLARINADGSLDRTFGSTGRVTLDFAGDYDEAHGLALQPDGKAVVVGVSTNRGQRDFTLARYVAITPSQLFVTQVYLDLLGRPPDDPGLAAWADLLDRGGTRDQMVRGVVGGVEYRTRVVQEMYQKFLRRAADTAGLNAFVSALGLGATVESVQAAIAGSLEYFQDRGGGTNDGFLQALYLDTLNRPPDAAGLAGFSQALRNGATPRQVALAVSESDEYRRLLVSGFYGRFLRRNPDSSGLNAFVNFLQQGRRQDEVIVALIASAEYLERIGA